MLSPRSEGPQSPLLQRYQLSRSPTPTSYGSGTSVSWDEKLSQRQITLRGTIAGLIIGSLVLVSNFQFGLQTGWVSMMSLPAALLAVAFFKQVWPLLFPRDPPFTDVETVYVQSMAVAVGTGPLTLGFVGVIPAIEKFVTFEESGWSRAQGTPFTFMQLVVWSTALAFFGIFFAVPLRKQVIVREKLPFPSGRATAVLVAVLNKSEILEEVTHDELIEMRKRRLGDEYPELLELEEEELLSLSRSSNRSKAKHPFKPVSLPHSSYLSQQTHSYATDSVGTVTGNSNSDNYGRHAIMVEPDFHTHKDNSNLDTDRVSVSTARSETTYNTNLLLLLRTFTLSSLYTMSTYFVPILTRLPLFGNYLSKTYMWNIQPSPAYIGQGIIMGLPTVSYMLLGAFLGWGILAPLARYCGWVPPDADPNDWERGIQGWILWVSLSIMVVDSVIGLLVVTVRSVVCFFLCENKAEALNTVVGDSIESLLMEEEKAINTRRAQASGGQQETVRLVSAESEHEVESKYLVRYTTVISGLIVSSAICVTFTVYLFGSQIIPISAMLIALLLALLLSILGVRALGETDLNPVSGIGKLSQLVFAVLIPRSHPGTILVNLVAGGVAEAGAQQAGDLMQDLKTGHLLNASPFAQFVAQLIGTVWSVVLSGAMYLVYNKVYDLPNDRIRIPTAVVWIDCARLVTGGGLPKMALECSLAFGSLFAILSLIKNVYKGAETVPKWLVYIPSGIAVGVGIYNTPSFTIARFVGGLISHQWMKKYRGDLSARTSMIVFSSGLVLGEGICSILLMVFTSLNLPHF